MHILFIHKNFPAQFRYIAPYLVREHGYRCTFVCERIRTGGAESSGIEHIQYAPQGRACPQSSHCGKSFEDQMWASQALLQTLEERSDIQPDLVVAHSGFFTTTFLREIYDCPIISFFEYFYRTTGGDCGFRDDLPQGALIDRARTRARNATFLLDLEHCDAGFAPTEWQRSRLPNVFQDKLHCCHDGIDTEQWRPATADERDVLVDWMPTHKKVVTYITRGFEAMRGFDIFMKVAKRLCDERDDVLFLVAGNDRVIYGGDHRFTGGKTFRDWVLSQDDYDLDRIRFVGKVPQRSVVSMLQRSDLHIYLTAPFVISWSPLDAMAAGCVVLGSDTAPVREVIRHNENGLLCDFFDVDGWVDQAHRVLDRPDEVSDLRVAARSTIQSRFSTDVCLPRLKALFDDVAGNQRGPTRDAAWPVVAGSVSHAQSRATVLRT